MKIALLDIKNGTKINSNFVSVNMRNMLLLKRELDAEFFYSASQIKNNKQKYDVIIFGFNSHNTETTETQKFIENNPFAKYFVLVGEYEQSDCVNLRYVKRNFSIIQNYSGASRIGLKEQHLNKYELNLNLLIAKPPNELVAKKYDCLYYGRWRENRKKYFQKYLQNDIYLSTSIKNMKLFKNSGCNPKYIDTLNWNTGRETLNLFKYSLYVEDEFTHKNFNNLANRYYESGFCNNVVFFDKNCWNTILKSEIGFFKDIISDYIVEDYNSLKQKIEFCNLDFLKHLAIQKSIRLNEIQLRSEMIQQIKKIIENETRSC